MARELLLLRPLCSRLLGLPKEDGLLLWLACVWALSLQTPVEDLIEDLGAETPEARDEAVRRLVELGEAVLPALRRARFRTDPEVSARAGDALDGIAWRSAEDKLGGFLQSRKLARSVLTRRDLTGAGSWVKDLRLYRVDSEGSGLLLLLRKDGEAVLSDPFLEGTQEFVQAALRDLRVQTDEDRLEAGRLCLTVLDQFKFNPGASPAAIATYWKLAVQEYSNEPRGVGFGGFWSKNPEFHVRFNAEGGIQTVFFCYRD